MKTLLRYLILTGLFLSTLFTLANATANIEKFNQILGSGVEYTP